MEKMILGGHKSAHPAHLNGSSHPEIHLPY